MYKIIKFKFEGEPEVIERGLSLQEARAYCRREDTEGVGWFCGYEAE
jgi:hypothetical protein